MRDKKSLLHFLGDRRGGVMPLFALSILPITGLIGAAVDYSRANAARSAMQAAVDSTALAMSKSAQNYTAAQLQTQATSFFNAIYNRPEASNVSVSTSYTNATTGSQVVVSGTGTVKPMFISVMGVTDFSIAATSTTVWGQQRLRVALALDNTGSMADAGKMAALKTATKNLLTSLKDASKTDGDVYVSIIPFSKDVNAGTGNVSESWIDWTDWDQANGKCSNNNYTTYSSCQSHSKTWTPKAHSTWNGCVTDRDQNYDEKNTTPNVSNSSTLFPAEQYSSCPTAVLGPTYDWTALNSKVDDMTPAGNTNQGIGLAWGWQSLTPGVPFNPPAKDPDFQYQDVLILLTDGLNTQNRYSSSQSAIDTRQQVTCTNAKAAGITVYTVQVNTGSDATSSLLQGCASDSKKFFLLTSSTQIITTFNTIGTQLSQLRIAK